jgi:hypothetical protein
MACNRHNFTFLPFAMHGKCVDGSNEGMSGCTNNCRGGTGTICIITHVHNLRGVFGKLNESPKIFRSATSSIAFIRSKENANYGIKHRA